MNLRSFLAAATAGTLAVTLAGCTAAPSALVVSGTAEDRLETVAVPAVSVPAVNLDAGFTTLTGATNPVTGRTGANLSTVGATYGIGTFVRLAEVSVSVGDTVTVDSPWPGRHQRPCCPDRRGRGGRSVAAAQVGLLGDAIDTTYDKEADVKDAKRRSSMRSTRSMTGRRSSQGSQLGEEDPR